MDENNPDLETFRKQWQEEVTARSSAKEHRYSGSTAFPQFEKAGASKAKAPLPRSEVHEEGAEPVHGISAQAYHDLEDKDDARRLGIEGPGQYPSTQTAKEPKSALEHYEKAIERENQGNLGDSVSLYRKAFRVSLHVSFPNRALMELQ